MVHNSRTSYKPECSAARRQRDQCRSHKRYSQHHVPHADGTPRSQIRRTRVSGRLTPPAYATRAPLELNNVISNNSAAGAQPASAPCARSSPATQLWARETRVARAPSVRRRTAHTALRLSNHAPGGSSPPAPRPEPGTPKTRCDGPEPDRPPTATAQAPITATSKPSQSLASGGPGSSAQRRVTARKPGTPPECPG